MQGKLSMEIMKTSWASKNANIIFVMMFISLYQFAWLIYIPNIPIMTSDLHTSPEAIQSSITLYMLGIGISQLVYGPLSDIHGRKNILLMGLIIFSLATIYIVINKTIASLLIGRLLQGLGAGSLSVIGKSIVSDTYSETKIIKANSLLSASTSISPIFSQALGGYVGEFIGWKMNFYVLLVYALILLIFAYYFLPETNRNSSKLKLTNYFKVHYLKILKLNRFYIYVSLYSVVLLSELLFQLIAPYEFENQFGISQHSYVIIAVLCEIGIVIGSILSFKINNQFLFKSIACGFYLLLLSSVIILIQSHFMLYKPVLFFGILFYFISIGFLLPLIITGTMDINRNQSGTVMALVGSVQMLSVSLCGTVASMIGVKTLLQMSISIGLLAFFCIVFSSKQDGLLTQAS